MKPYTSNQFPTTPPRSNPVKWALFEGGRLVMTANTPEQYPLLVWEKKRREKQGQRFLTIKPTR